jgi:hypothetical protein
MVPARLAIEEGNNETIETNERRGCLPFVRELSRLSLFLELPLEEPIPFP